MAYAAKLPPAHPDPLIAPERHHLDLTENEVAVLADTDVHPKPARGFMNGIAITMPLWCLIGLLDWPRLAV
jgi:hypothetical protein